MDDSENCLFSQPNDHSTDCSSLCAFFPVMTTAKGPNSGKGAVYRRKEVWVEDGRDPFYRQVPAGLPDVVLLEIFDFYFEEEQNVDNVDYWHTLVHVCRRWRNVVFSSPRRLHLQLLCKPGRTVTEMLDIWPELPIIVLYGDTSYSVKDADNVIAALKLKGSVSGIDLTVIPRSAKWENIAAVMQDTFPMLEDLSLRSYYEDTAVISDSFLGGSAPRLRVLFLRDILFPALPNLLSSATDLVDLWLWDIPHSGYISPEAMITCISVLTRLKSLSLQFRSPRSRPDRVRRFLHPLTRTLLPALTYLGFRGVTEYLEVLVARIDVPLLERTDIMFFNQLVFDISQFPNFVCRTEKFTVLDQADVVLYSDSINIKFPPKGGAVDFIELCLGISCRKLDWQLSALAQVCNLCFPILPRLGCLSLCDDKHIPPRWQDDMEDTQWLELLRPFSTAKDLYLSKRVAIRIGSALQGLSDEQVTEVLPALQDIFIDDPQPSGLVEEGFHGFVNARRRQVSSPPVAIHRWVRKKEGEEE